MKTTKNILLAIALFTFLFSCGKKDTPPINGGPDPIETVETYGLYVLSEGSFGQNNTMLTYFNMETQAATTDFYADVNGNGLGDTGNDMLIYGSKLYIAMNVSSYLEVADAQTGKSIKKIELIDENETPREPRQLAFDKGRIFVSCTDGSVQVIDTASLAITNSIEVGSNPEGMAIVGNQLFVANSGGFNWPDYDSTLSVVDLNTLTEIRKIKVGLNPVEVTTDGEGSVFVGLVGNYDDVAGGIVKVDVESLSVSVTSDIAGAKMQYFDGKIFVVAGPFGSQTVEVLNALDLSVSNANFIAGGRTAVISPYALNIDEANGDVYVGDRIDFDGTPGKVYCFDKEGNKKFSFSTAPAAGPNTVVFLRKW